MGIPPKYGEKAKTRRDQAERSAITLRSPTASRFLKASDRRTGPERRKIEVPICGNPPYKGTKNQSDEQKDDLASVFDGRLATYKSLDYVAAWFFKAALYSQHTKTFTAFVSTNSICQGGQVPLLWPAIFNSGNEILFAHTSFLWRNLAAHNAGVTVAVVGFGPSRGSAKKLYSLDKDGSVSMREVENINAYLVAGRSVIAEGSSSSVSKLPRMVLGNQPYEGNNLILESDEFSALTESQLSKFTRKLFGSSEYIRGGRRRCLWIMDENLEDALKVPMISDRIERTKNWRLASKRPGTRVLAKRSHQFCEMYSGKSQTIIVPIRSSESREYLPVGLLDQDSIVSNLAYALYDAPLWCLAIIASKLHLMWIATVCGRMKTDYSYSNKMGWNTFPVPNLTERNKADLTRCAEDILLAREAHFPATIADLYDPEKMPANLRAAHDHNDEVLERIYIGRRFRNDTERLEKLFEMYTKMTRKVSA